MIFNGSIDAHVHLWDIERRDDILVLDSHPELGRAGEADQLKSHIVNTGISGAIVVQSAPSTIHSDWLRLAARHMSGVIGVVGWIDLKPNEFAERLAVLRDDPLVCGVRVMINRLERPENILTPQAITLLSDVSKAGLTIECLTPPHLLQIVGELADFLPSAQFVLDHCGLPPGRDGDLVSWENDLKRVSAQRNVAAKFSGLIEPFGNDSRLQDVEDRALKTLELFGPKRLMIASNFPVVDFGGGTEKWAEFLQKLLDRAQLSQAERNLMLAGTALDTFSLSQSLNIGDRTSVPLDM